MRSLPSMCLLFVLLSSITCLGAVTTSEDASLVVAGWLLKNDRPFGAESSVTIEDAETFSSDDGVALYHVVSLAPSGFVVVAADDRIEPIIASVAKGRYEHSKANPLRGLLTTDLRARVEHAWQSSWSDARLGDNRARWNRLRARVATPAGRLSIAGQLKTSEMADIRVYPLVKSAWAQTDVGGLPCFNYFTPNNYPCGCTVTAAAQVLRYLRHPSGRRGVFRRDITVDGVTQYRWTGGGDGEGGPFDWDNMPLDPNSDTPDYQRQAIGRLCYDLGVATNTDYEEGGSGTTLEHMTRALRDEFAFSYGIYAYWSEGNDPVGDEFIRMVLPNLDARVPVLLGLRTAGDGKDHAVVVDGYGYDESVLYHHLNLGWGWGGTWYTLPPMELGYGGIKECTYNLRRNYEREIISGRIFNQLGYPVNGLHLELYQGVGGTAEIVVDDATTNEIGIFAFDLVGQNTVNTILVAPTDKGLVVTPADGRLRAIPWTGKSDGHHPANHWGIDVTVELKQCELQISNQGLGEVSINGEAMTLPFSGDFPVLSQLRLRAEPIGGCLFDRWTGDVFSDEPDLDLQFVQATALTAHFTYPGTQQLLRVERTGSGSVYVNGQLKTLPYQQQFNYGATVTLRAQGSELEPFMYWTDEGKKEQETTFTVTLNGPRTIKASFFVPGTGESGRIMKGFKEWQKNIETPSLLPWEGGGRIWQGEDANWYFKTDETTAGSRDAWDASYVCTSSDGKVCADTHGSYAYVHLYAGPGSDARVFGVVTRFDAGRKCVEAGLKDFHENQRLGGSEIYSDTPAGSGGFVLNVYAAWDGIDVYQIYGKLTYDQYVAPCPNPYPKSVQSNATTFNIGVGASDDYTTVRNAERSLTLEKGKCVSVVTCDGSIAGRREDAQQGAVPDYLTGGATEYVAARFTGDSRMEQDVPLANLIGGNIFVAPQDGRLTFYSTLPASYADKRGGCIIQVQICDCTEFDGCGTLVYIEPPAGHEIGCVLFRADNGRMYYLDKLGSFEAGDHVRVQGMIMCSCERSFCSQPVNGCITVITIEPCCNVDLCQYEALDQGFSPSSIQAGQSLTITHGWANCGTVNLAPGWRIRYYASTDTTITSADYLLYEDTIPIATAAGKQSSQSITFTFPSGVPAGRYYIGWILDPTNEICESNENNNAGYIKGVRLTVGSSSADFEGCGTIVRKGEFCLLFQADAGGFYRLSTFGDFSTGDRVWVQGQITSGAGTYCGEQIQGYIAVVIIRLCNTSCTADFCQYDTFDQGLYPSTIRAGQTLTLSFGGANCGTTDIPAGWKLRYYASTNTTITSSDYFLYEAVADFGIGAGWQLGLLEEFVFPSGVPAGTYYIGWIFDPDNEICESDENNNAGYIKGTRLTVVGTTTPSHEFEGCGTIIERCLPETSSFKICCTVFHADSGEFYYLSTLGGFNIGDRVYVEGDLDMTVWDSYADGLIAVTTITPCVAN